MNDPVKSMGFKYLCNKVIIFSFGDKMSGEIARLSGIPKLEEKKKENKKCTSDK